MLMREYADLFEKIDVFACPSFGASSLGATNLTGHPTVVVPNGFREDGTPTSICFTSGLYREGDAVALAHLYQSKSDWHKARPTL
jgi:Asp-tRNA(Asn)/Glu-tRNA(Gln) amidotransferase A subunit family amidase